MSCLHYYRSIVRNDPARAHTGDSLTQFVYEEHTQPPRCGDREWSKMGHSAHKCNDTTSNNSVGQRPTPIQMTIPRGSAESDARTRAVQTIALWPRLIHPAENFPPAPRSQPPISNKLMSTSFQGGSGSGGHTGSRSGPTKLVSESNSGST